VLVQCPVFGGTLKSFDASAAQKMPGVRAVLPLARTATSAAAVAVVADHHWQARKALAAVTVTWDDGPAAGHDTTTQRERYRALLREGDARVYDEAGEVEHALAAPPVLVDAEYFAPYLAHATMEPVNATAIVRRDGTCEVWVGNQAPTLVKWFAAQAAGVDTDRVTVHTPHLGGGFGRRIEMDVVLQAVTLARSLPDTPVQLLWSREDDMQHDVYRPMAAARMQAALDSSGRVIGWAARVVSQSCTGEFSARLLPAAASDAMKDKTTTEGLFDLPYRLPNRRTSHVLTHEPVPVGYWRSVGHGHNAFFAESFVDECAAAAKRDPVEFRRALLADSPRHRQVLDVAAEVAHDGEAVLFHQRLDGVADVAERRTGADRGDAAHHALIGHVHQQPRLGGGGACHVHAAGVAVPAIEDHGDVDIDDVAIGQHPLTRYAVAHDMVDRGAGGFRVAAIAERRGGGAPGHDELVQQAVELLGRDPRRHMRGDHVERLGRQAASAAHPLEIRGGVDGDAAGFAALLLHGEWDIRRWRLE
jgi:isoquinoline 1-oxidoreductase beta subunit